MIKITIIIIVNQYNKIQISFALDFCDDILVRVNNNNKIIIIIKY